MIHKINIFIALMLVASSNAYASEMTQEEAKERLALLNKSQFIVSKAAEFQKDDDYYTVQIVLADEKDDTPSSVSEDGQVLFANSHIKYNVEELIEQTTIRRLAHKPI